MKSLDKKKPICPSPENPCMCDCHTRGTECWECRMGRHKEYKGEVGKLYKVNYSLVDRGDGLRCAWCDKLNPSQKHLDKHIKSDKLIMNKGGQDDNRKVSENCCSSKTANVHPKELDWHIKWDYLLNKKKWKNPDEVNKVLTKFIEDLLTQQRTELLEEIKYLQTYVLFNDTEKLISLEKVKSLLNKKDE